MSDSHELAASFRFHLNLQLPIFLFFSFLLLNVLIYLGSLLSDQRSWVLRSYMLYERNTTWRTTKKPLVLDFPCFRGSCLKRLKVQIILWSHLPALQWVFVPLFVQSSSAGAHIIFNVSRGEIAALISEWCPYFHHYNEMRGKIQMWFCFILLSFFPEGWCFFATFYGAAVV